jgi:hypothetical protein
MYQHGKRVNRPHNYKIFLATLAIIGVVVLGAWFMIHKDIASTTGPKSNVPIISNVDSSSGTETIKIDEDYFTFELPKDWKLTGETHENYANFYTWTATKQGVNDRKLTLHVDIMPQAYKVVKLLPLTPNGSNFLLGTISDDCVNFSGSAQQRQSNAEFQAKWQDVIFVCDPISANQTIGTGSKTTGIGVPLTGSRGTHTYFFYFEDHNIHPDSTILRDALLSFKVR